MQCFLFSWLLQFDLDSKLIHQNMLKEEQQKRGKNNSGSFNKHTIGKTYLILFTNYEFSTEFLLSTFVRQTFCKASAE